MNLEVLAANASLFLSSWGGYQDWRYATSRVKKQQFNVLKSILGKNVETEFGKQHQFLDVRSVEDFQRLIPLRDYADFAPYIDQIANGESAVLTSDLVSRLEPSSGSTSASKLVPYTETLASEFQQGIDPWLYSLYASHPKLLSGKHYWSISPVAQSSNFSPGGIPIGFEDDSEYLSPLKRRVLNTLMAVPSAIGQISDMETFRYTTLRFLLQCEDLVFISVWNPTFLSLLLKYIKAVASDLLSDINSGKMAREKVSSTIMSALPKADSFRASKLESIFTESNFSDEWRSKQGRSVYEEIWPKLSVISCWADSSSKQYANQLQKLFPNVVIQPKGLLATEGFITFPVGRDSAAALSVNSHFYEFAELDSHRIRLAHELEVGHKYSVIITTGGGLYRYKLNDLVEVIGHIRECPTFRFLGKAEAIVDNYGEKLNEIHVEKVVTKGLSGSGISPKFWMMAPEQLEPDSGRYVLYVQLKDQLPKEELENFSQAVELKLQENFHYQYCRKLGQLSALKVFLIEPFDIDATELYLSTCQSLGQRLGNIKPTRLHSYRGWSKVFSGQYL